MYQQSSVARRFLEFRASGLVYHAPWPWKLEENSLPIVNFVLTTWDFFFRFFFQFFYISFHFECVFFNSFCYVNNIAKWRYVGCCGKLFLSHSPKIWMWSRLTQLFPFFLDLYHYLVLIPYFHQMYSLLKWWCFQGYHAQIPLECLHPPLQQRNAQRAPKQRFRWLFVGSLCSSLL